MLNRTVEKFKKFNVIDLYVNGDYSLNQLQTLVQSDKRTIRDYLLANEINVSGLSINTIKPDKNILGLSKSDNRFNFEIFKVIDTEEKAYWLGFIFADGYVSKDGATFELGLQAKDVGHLHKFNRFMQCTDNNVSYHPKKTENKIFDFYRWNIRNTTLWNSLNDYGCTPNKSLTLQFPRECKFQNISLIKHFIRGYWDGDGCITLTSKTKIISVLGTKDFLTSLKSYIPSLKEKKLYLHKSVNNKTFSLQTSHNEAYEVLKYLYQDAFIYLDRKYEKYLDFCRLYEES